MKYNLLGAVSTIALGAAFGVSTHGTAEAGLTCSGGAQATGSFTCSETVTAGFTLTPASTILTLNQWMSTASAGYTQTLKSVKFTISEILTGVGGVKNTDTVAVYGSFSSQTTLSATPGSGAPSNFLVPTYLKQTSVTGPEITLSAGVSVPYSYSAQVTGPTKTITTSLSSFIGAGTFSALVSAVMGNGGFRSNPAGNFAGSVTTSAAPTIQLTYSFTTANAPPPPSPTPEPASLALLGAGLAGLGAVRRRRKS